MKLSAKTQVALHGMVEHLLDREIDAHQMVDLPTDPYEAATQLVSRCAPGKGQLSVAWAQALAILGSHDLSVNAKESEAVLLVLAARAGELPREEFTKWLRARSAPATETPPSRKPIQRAPRPKPTLTLVETNEVAPQPKLLDGSVSNQSPTKPVANPWEGKIRGAISLSYDGGQLCHIEHALPYLNALGLKATFYVDGADFVAHVNRWKEARNWGHEIANGCIVKAAYPDGRMPAWTQQMIQDEIHETQVMFREVLGEEPTDFALPWGYPQCQNGADYRHVAQGRFLYARSGLEGYNDPGIASLKYLRCVRCEDYDADDLIRLAETGLARGSWIIFAFDGIGSGDRAIDHATHQNFLRWVHQNRFEIHVDTVHNVAGMLAERAPA